MDEHPRTVTQTHLASEGRAEEAQDSRGRWGSACHYHADTPPETCLFGGRRKQKKASETTTDGKTMSIAYIELAQNALSRIDVQDFLPMARSWNLMIFKDSSNPNHSVVLWCGHVWKYKLALKLSWGIKPHSVYRDQSAHVPGKTSCSASAPATALPGQAADLALGTAGKNRLFPHPVSLLIYTSLVLMNFLSSPLK